MKKYKCQSNVCTGCCFDPCDYIYDEALGDPENGIAPGTKLEDLPEEWGCPSCGSGKDVFLEIKED